MFCCAAKGIGFLSDIRRMNVALTRAKFGLFVVGKSTALLNNPHWGALVNHAKEKQLCTSFLFGALTRPLREPFLNSCSLIYR
jgi:superfamily I DNA and/or RNA helicase